MSAKTRQGRQAHPPAAAQTPWATHVQTAVLAGIVALVISAALMPSESAITEGTFAPLAALAVVLLLSWSAAIWLGRQSWMVLGWTELAGAALIGWHSLAALVSLGQVNGRQALNGLWLLVGYGCTAFLFRQLLRSAAQVRAVVVVMIWLATLLASLGFYQYFYSLPTMRRQYEANPEQVLRDEGFSTDKNSPQRTLLENRLRSVEPLATFALTNSLAGLLAPWLIASLAIGLGLLGDLRQRRTLIALAIITMMLAACLVLTKSRTAYLAVLAGLPLAALYAAQHAWRLDWRIPTIAGGVLLVIGLAAVALGGLDVQVLSEAPKSILYRLEYWQATGALIADRPLFGAGPGSFQAAYAMFKLPQASEMIADPHNFLLEMWATAGTPGIVLLLLLMAGFVLDLSNKAADTLRLRPAGDGTPSVPATMSAAQPIFVGALLGLFAAMPLNLLVGYPLDGLFTATPLLPVVWILGVPLLAACWWLFEPWIVHGRLPIAALTVPIVVLLINLLAAGAIVFPGVVSTLLVLAPAVLAAASVLPSKEGNSQSLPSEGEQQSRSRVHSLLGFFPRQVRLSSFSAGLLTLAAACLAVACLRTEYHPLLNSHSALRQAAQSLSAGDRQAAEAAAQNAAAADPLAPEPWRLLAELRLARWLAAPNERDWNAFTQAAEEFQRRDPVHHAAHYARGNWYFAAWRRNVRPADLSEAIAAYRGASMFYPNRALYHAQLARLLFLSGERSLAAQAADRAKELDDLMPHAEQKLRNQHLFDPELTKPGRDSKASSAELIVDQLRTTEKENMP